MGLEAVEIVISVEEAFEISISDTEAEQLQTPRHLIDHICSKLITKDDPSICLSQKAFHNIRASILKTTGVAREDITLDTRLREVFQKEGRKETWSKFREEVNIEKLPNLTFGSGLIFRPITVKDLVTKAISHQVGRLKPTDHWTRSEVREVVRQIISEQLGVYDFSDNDEFIRDLGC